MDWLRDYIPLLLIGGGIWEICHVYNGLKSGVLVERINRKDVTFHRGEFWFSFWIVFHIIFSIGTFAVSVFLVRKYLLIPDWLHVYISHFYSL
ncbi:hypothetical protein IW00_17640 [Pectobacterium brasiliense]|nr:hypothetical protein IW00_17640 [Pectobacterium brasiliense]